MLNTVLRVIAFFLALLMRIVMAATVASIPFDRPLVFEPNLGQAPDQVSWSTRGQRHQHYLAAPGAFIVLAEPVAPSKA